MSARMESTTSFQRSNNTEGRAVNQVVIAGPRVCESTGFVLRARKPKFFEEHVNRAAISYTIND